MLLEYPSKIKSLFIQLVVDFNGTITTVLSGDFCKEAFSVHSSVYTSAPFLEGTLDALLVNEPFLLEGMLIVLGDKEFNVDVELLKEDGKITVLFHDRTSVYKYIDELNQKRNDLFFVKRKIAENNKETKRLMMRLEQSKALPTLYSFVNYNFIANSETFTFFNSSQQWINTSVLGVSLNVPIFSSFGRKAKTTQAKIALENANIKLQETKQRLSLLAQKAKGDYQLSIENYNDLPPIETISSHPKDDDTLLDPFAGVKGVDIFKKYNFITIYCTDFSCDLESFGIDVANRDFNELIYVGGETRNSKFMLRENFLRPKFLFDLCSDLNIKFVYMSTLSIFGCNNTEKNTGKSGWLSR